MNYTKADSLLQGRNMLRRKVGNNTYLVRNSGVTGDKIHLKLHNTYIMTFYADGKTELNSGGWRTVTTKDRLNKHLENGYRIVQRNGQWYVSDHREDVALFDDGMTIAADGTLAGTLSLDEERKLLALRKQVSKFAGKYADAFLKGQVKAPGAGDCFYCQLRDEKGKTMGENFGNKDHFVSHLKENYFVPSILYRAMEVMPTSIAFKGTVAAMWAGKPEQMYFKTDDKYFRQQVKTTVYRYVLKQMGQAY